MAEEHMYCKGLEDGYRLKRELTKTALKLSVLQHSALEEGAIHVEQLKPMLDTVKKEYERIYKLLNCLVCRRDEALCVRNVQRLFVLLSLLRNEIELLQN